MTAPSRGLDRESRPAGSQRRKLASNNQQSGWSRDRCSMALSSASGAWLAGHAEQECALEDPRAPDHALERYLKVERHWRPSFGRSYRLCGVEGGVVQRAAKATGSSSVRRLDIRRCEGRRQESCSTSLDRSIRWPPRDRHQRVRPSFPAQPRAGGWPCPGATPGRSGEAQDHLDERGGEGRVSTTGAVRS
jgi:hypothetical protein